MVRNQLPAQVVNLLALEWRAMRIFSPQIAILSQFQVYLSKNKMGKANNKFIISQ